METSSKTVAQASADYRQRRANKIARYELALLRIADGSKAITTAFARDIARNALSQETSK